MDAKETKVGERPRRHRQVVNLDELAGHAGAGPGAATMKQLGAAAGGVALGCTFFEVPPGRSGFPRHFHCVNEEAVFVLEGQGRLKLGEAEIAVRVGDWVALPVGPASAHEMVNTGAGALRYLCLSTMQPTDVTIYPETRTLAVMAGGSIEAARRGESWVSVMLEGAAPSP
jgi:uncharacterized cupin superfamily protein